MTVNSPGSTKLMTPAHMHINVEVLSSVGMSASNTVGAPGTHGATVIGMQGIGVRTPMAAAVAAATIGFAGEIHTPNGMMFTIGILSMMLASGISLVKTMFVGRTTSELGAIPMVHIIMLYVLAFSEWKVVPIAPPPYGQPPYPQQPPYPRV